MTCYCSDSIELHSLSPGIDIRPAVLEEPHKDQDAHATLTVKVIEGKNLAKADSDGEKS